MIKNKKRKEAAIPKRFVPRFWNDADGRCAVIKEIRRRIERLKRHVGCDSMQRELLCERAVFVASQIETAEVNAARGKPFEANVYTQQVNCLLGLLKALGLKKSEVSDVINLKTYLKKGKRA